MNCRDCQHWYKTEHFDFVAFECHTPDMILGTCRMADPRYDVPENKYQSVATCNNESIYGELITQDNFGCILFKKRV